MCGLSSANDNELAQNLVKKEKHRGSFLSNPEISRRSVHHVLNNRGVARDLARFCCMQGSFGLLYCYPELLSADSEVQQKLLQIDRSHELRPFEKANILFS